MTQGYTADSSPLQHIALLQLAGSRAHGVHLSDQHSALAIWHSVGLPVAGGGFGGAESGDACGAGPLTLSLQTFALLLAQCKQTRSTGTHARPCRRTTGAQADSSSKQPRRVRWRGAAASLQNVGLHSLRLHPQRGEAGEGAVVANVVQKVGNHRCWHHVPA